MLKIKGCGAWTLGYGIAPPCSDEYWFLWRFSATTALEPAKYIYYSQKNRYFKWNSRGI